MAEYFKAAAKCDGSVIRQSPIYIDPKVVMEEQYRHEQLVEQCLRTKQLLEAMERSEEQAKLNPATPPYRTPPVIARDVPPAERNLGSVALKKQLDQRLNLWKKRWDDAHFDLESKENKEQKKNDEHNVELQRNSDREFNALVVSRQIAAAEAEALLVREREEKEKGLRRPHPIDVLHKAVAHDLVEDCAETTAARSNALLQEQLGLEQFVDEQKLRQLRYDYFGPSLHVPSGF